MSAPQFTPGPWKRDESLGFTAYVHPSGARVKQIARGSRMRSAAWEAQLPDGSTLRVDKNDDGTDYVPGPGQRLPRVHLFPSGAAAKRAVLAKAQGAPFHAGKSALLKFIRIRNESGLSSNLQFSIDAREAGIDLDLLGDARKSESGGYEWSTPHGLLVEYPDGQMELLA